MKTNYILPAMLGICMFMGACDKQLDLEPENTITEDKVFEKFYTAESAVAGTYHMLFSAATNDYVIAEATAPTCGYSSSAARSYDDINNGVIRPEDENLQQIYENYYAAAVQANLLLHKIPKLGKYDAADMKQHMAEAKFIRAFAYLRLLGWYGDGALMNQPQKDGIVMYLEHYDGFDRDTDIHPRNSNQQVFQQIINDLEEAIVDLPDPSEQEGIETRVGRANKATCEALLTRAYLYQRDYSNALIWANKALSHSEYQLEEDVLTVFPPNPDDAVIPFSKEHIFGFPVSSNGGNWQFGGNGVYYSNNHYWYSQELISTFADSDLRKTKLMNQASYQGNPVYITKKYPNTSGRDNMTMMRLPEIILSKAEALAHTSNTVTQEMIGLLNAVHLRANPNESGYIVADFASSNEYLSRVLLERNKELAFEGCSRFDHLRTDRPLYNPELADNKKVLPIPLREIQISNGLVKQNEGYINN